MIIMEWLSQDFAARLAETLLHTLWQGAILSALLFAVLRVIPVKRPNTRYVACLLALVGLLLSGFVTSAILGYEPVETVSDAEKAAIVSELPPVEDASPATIETTALPGEPVNETASGMASAAWAGWAAGLWAVGVIIMLARMSIMVLGANRLRRRCHALEDAAVHAILSKLQGLLKVTRKVGLACSECIQGPMVVGMLRPTILLPASLIAGVPIEQIEAVLAHELAHIRRYDYLINLGQMLIEALLFFNPALWWISRQIRVEREACCDALAETVAARDVGYARALAGVVERLTPSAQPGAAMAFAGPNESGGFVDRIRRLAVPFHRPIPRLPVHGFAAALLGAVLLGGILWCGTTVAVDEAAKLLSPEERVKELARIEEEYGWKHKDLDTLDNVTVSGTVRTHDGSPLPEDMFIKIRVRLPRQSTSYAVDVTDGRFSREVHFGRIFLRVKPKQYARAFLGPFTANPGESLDDIDIVLQPGFTGKIKVLTPDGEPVPDARIRGGFIHENINTGDIDLSTDETGTAYLNHCVSWPMKLNVIADGYERGWRKEVILSAEAVCEWRLKPAKPATGIVVWGVTGEPVPGAALRLAERFGHEPMTCDLETEDKHAQIMARTEDDGTFQLTSLRSDCQYVFLVKAPGMGRTFLRGVSAGDTSLKVELGPEIYVRGRIVGMPLESMRDPSKLSISFSQTYRSLSGSGHSSVKNVPVQVKEGQGSFFIPNRWPGKISIAGAGWRRSIKLEKAIEDFVIDLTPPPADEKSLRDVVIRFTVPDGAPTPSGEIEVAHAVPGAAAYSGYTKLPITDGEVRCKVPAPCDLLYRSKGIVGYWLKDKSGVKVSAGTGPFIITVELAPAGAIYGAVVDTDGAPVMNARITAVVVKKAPSMKHPFLDNNPPPSGMQGRFESGPLPLGGTYVIVANRRGSRSYVLSKEITLTVKQPMVEIELEFPEGVRVNGQILKPDGHPAVGVACGLAYGTPYSHGLGYSPTPTDAEGRFSIEHVNPDVPGTYTLRVRPQRNFQPLGMKIKPNAKPLTIHLKRGQILTGTVIGDKTGEPESGVRVRAWLENRKGLMTHTVYAELPTNTQGEFRFSNLPEGRCHLSSENRRLAHDRPEVDVTKGTNPSVTLRLAE